MKRTLKFCKYYFSKAKVYFTLNIVALIFVHFFTYLVPYANKIILDKFFFMKEYNDMVIYVSVFVIILIFSNLVTVIERVSGYYTDEKANTEVRNNILLAIFKKDFIDYSKKNYGEIETVYNASLNTISNSIYCIIETLIAVPIAILVGGRLIVSVTPILIIFLVLEIVLMMLTAKLGAKKLGEKYENTLMARKSYFSNLERIFNSFENIRMNFLSWRILNKLFSKSQQFKKRNLQYKNTDVFIQSVFEIIEITFQIVTIIIFIFMIKNYNVTPGEYIAYISIKTAVIGVFNGLAQVALRYKELTVAVTDINKIIDIDNLIDINYLSEYKESKTKMGLCDISNISLKNVKFSYNENSVIYNLNYEFKKGKIYIIQGENGIGKSTLIRLLTGMLKPSEGYILINNKEVSAFNEEELFNRIRVLTQNPVLYDDSFLNNLLHNKDNIDDFNANKLLKSYFDISDIVQKYSNGIHSNVFENGISLSGGQIKKLCIQSILVSNSDILIFDEPFGELDENSKDTFYNFIKNIYKDKIVIIISHDNNRNWSSNETLLNLELNEQNIIMFNSKHFKEVN